MERQGKRETDRQRQSWEVDRRVRLGPEKQLRLYCKARGAI
jgi:hypothetical protein